MARGREAVTPAIEAVARRGPSEGDPSALERILASATMVRDRVRYVAVELGIGGYQPRPASETLSKLYGDCKDKGTLLQSVLDRKSTRLNSSHSQISYAVFCLK